MLMDALTDKHAGCAMGITAENLAENYGITRDQAEEFAVGSHQKAAMAYEKNLLQGEIEPFETKRGIVERDEHLRPESNKAEMAKLRSSFKKDGVVTPATASGIVDGASSCLIASGKFCEDNGLTPLARICDGVVVGVDPTIMGIGPVPAIEKLLERSSLKLSDIDLIEINEAFAAVVLKFQKDMGVPDDKINVCGGSIALGQPIGATGPMLIQTVLDELERQDKTTALIAMCTGGGMGTATIIERI
jgi:acetyl-CoA C-acetyltransferase/acetyl-CoA acyltransferase 2